MKILTLIIQSYGLRKLASDMAVSYQAVRKWEVHEIPADRVLQLCEIIRWEYSPHEIRPDIYPHPDDGLPECMRKKQAA